MPRKRAPKRAQPKLSKDEIEEMEAFGYDDEDMAEMEQRLAVTTWKFQSKAATMRLELAWQPDLFLASGKKTRNLDNLTAKFKSGFYPTRDRREAFLIYMSDAFRDERVWDYNEAEAARVEEKYQDFKEMVSNDPEKLERLKEDLAAEEQIPA